jgi:hypothetical protein
MHAQSDWCCVPLALALALATREKQVAGQSVKTKVWQLECLVAAR